MSMSRQVGFALSLIALLPAIAGRSPAQDEQVTGCHESLNVRPVSLDDGWTLMSSDGRILTSKRYSSSDEFSDGLFLFGTNEGWEYLDQSGKKILSLKGNFIAETFSEGLAAVDDRGFIDKTGHTAIPGQFDMTSAFSEGLAAVQTNDVRYYIDKTGRAAISPKYENQVVQFLGDFRSGLAWVVVSPTPNGDSQSGYIDKAGNWMVRPGMYAAAAQFYGGLAAVQVDKRWGFIDTSGRLRIPATFVSVGSRSFEGGPAAVAVIVGGQVKYGFIDEQGSWVVSPRFSRARPFCDGLAPVEMKGLWGYVDSNDKISIQPRFVDAQAFDGGIASVVTLDKENRKHAAYIDTHGNVVWESKHTLSFIEIWD
jgi:WG containing repeat